jgi:hypothetical protein
MREWVEERREAGGLSLNWMTSKAGARDLPILFLHGVLRR